MNAAKKISTVEQFLESDFAKTEKRAQFKDGQVVLKLMPGCEHGKVQFKFCLEIGRKFHSAKSNDGGWWFKTETSIYCQKSKSILTPDILGWKRSNYPKEPVGYPAREKPDWVCEVAFSTLQTDVRESKEIYEREEIPFYWVADVKNSRLVVFELLEKKLVQTLELFPSDGLVEIPPFLGDKLDVRELFGLEE